MVLDLLYVYIDGGSYDQANIVYGYNSFFSVLVHSEITINGQAYGDCNGSVVVNDSGAYCNGERMDAGGNQNNACYSAEITECGNEKVQAHPNGGGLISLCAMRNVDTQVYISDNSRVCGTPTLKGNVQINQNSVIAGTTVIEATAGKTVFISGSQITGSAHIQDTSIVASMISGSSDIIGSKIESSNVSGSADITNSALLTSNISGSSDITDSVLTLTNVSGSSDIERSKVTNSQVSGSGDIRNETLSNAVRY